MVFQASVVIGAVVWGGIADAIGVRYTLLVASATFVPGLLVIPWFGLPIIDRRDMKVVPRPSPEVAVEPEADDGPLMVLVEYQVAAEDHQDFIEVMEELRVVRRRTGGSRWSLFEDLGRPLGRRLRLARTTHVGPNVLEIARYQDGGSRTRKMTHEKGPCTECPKKKRIKRSSGLPPERPQQGCPYRQYLAGLSRPVRHGAPWWQTKPRSPSCSHRVWWQPSPSQ